jgi:hypothetical protein
MLSKDWGLNIEKINNNYFMRDYILDVLLVILNILIAVLAIPALFTIIAAFIAAGVIVFVAGILLSPILLVCVLKDNIKERNR